MSKYNIYAVAYGIDPKTNEPVSNLKFTNWNDCKPYVVGIEGAKYKGFLTDEEADTWLLQKTEKFEKNVTCLHVDCSEEFNQMCAKLDIKPEEMTARLQDDFVKQMKYIEQAKARTK
jgi:viroplasmin and RNaseH domain-containing protein